MKKSLTTIISMLWLTAAMPFLWHMKMSQMEEEEDESEKTLGRIVRSLNSVQQGLELKEQQKHSRTVSIIQQSFPWVIQNNTLPNYFLHGGIRTGGENYRNGALVFVHHHRAAGTAVRQCLDILGQDSSSFAMSPVMGSDDRLDWDNGELIDTSFRDRLKVHRGQFSFGMCNGLQRKCSNFVILRDPIERSMSSYHYCKEAMGDELCKVLNANEVTLRQWILHHGSLFFQQLLFQSNNCHLVPNITSNYNQFGDVQYIEPEKMPCWFKHKLTMEQMTAIELKHILDYVLENLEKWFAVLGLFEDLDNSLTMFEHVYKLPFKSCYHFKKRGSNTNVFDNRANQQKRRGGFYDDNDPEYLKYDYEVRSALEEDYKIYRKARKIYQIQKQMALNKVSR